MGAIYDQMILRNTPQFRDFIHAAVLQVADNIRNEDPSTEYHAARVAMADKLIETNETVGDDFIGRILFRAIMEPSIRSTVVRNGHVVLPDTDEEPLLDGIEVLWNETTLAVWPSVLEDL